MILNAVIHGRYYYAETWSEMSELITEVIENLKPEDAGSPWISPGEQACFMFADGRHTADTRTWWPDNYLYVSVNSSTGYGGLTWFVGEERAVEANGISDYVWVSDNPAPPAFDPRVVSDPGFPLFYAPGSTLPVSQVRGALEEFCRTGTGDRPESIQWVCGETNGQRVDYDS
ncbi:MULTISPECIES: Imm1 family immunity protein [Kitasatospora]|uniref:Imm1 family immunity protein n=1 Tax=Kitasatospora TaxID=2063 RepID=UPI001E3CFF0E|nr:Imm1 family immunity protein [Kitasatospora setae]